MEILSFNHLSYISINYCNTVQLCERTQTFKLPSLTSVVLFSNKPDKLCQICHDQDLYAQNGTMLLRTYCIQPERNQTKMPHKSIQQQTTIRVPSAHNIAQTNPDPIKHSCTVASLYKSCSNLPLILLSLNPEVKTLILKPTIRDLTNAISGCTAQTTRP